MEESEEEVIIRAKELFLNITADYGYNKDLSKYLLALNNIIPELNEWINGRELYEISTPYFFQIVEIGYRFYWYRDIAKGFD